MLKPVQHSDQIQEDHLHRTIQNTDQKAEAVQRVPEDLEHGGSADTLAGKKESGHGVDFSPAMGLDLTHPACTACMHA